MPFQQKHKGFTANGPLHALTLVGGCECCGSLLIHTCWWHFHVMLSMYAMDWCDMLLLHVCLRTGLAVAVDTLISACQEDTAGVPTARQLFDQGSMNVDGHLRGATRGAVACITAAWTTHFRGIQIPASSDRPVNWSLQVGGKQGTSGWGWSPLCPATGTSLL